MDVVIITPEPGQLKQIGQRLLALADHPSQVQWVTWPTAGYQVPVELEQRLADETAASEEEDDTPKTAKKRGRPKKQPVESTDNTGLSEE